MKNISLTFIITIIFSIVFLLSCDDSWRRDRGHQKWKSSDPYSIPLDIRRQEIQKDNIAPNSSFEEGSMSRVDSSGTEFTLKNWEIIGNGVSWEFINDSAESKTKGKYCIKISREKSPENDTLGSGIRSDFIAVIPGNYDFKMLIKLSNISSPDSRLGTKLYKSINIRVEYFDEKKIPIDPMNLYPYTKTKLDNGFKGYGFSNFWYIDSMPWNHYRARSYNYPYSDGDIPDNCRFIKLFIGLQGNGNMWVDHISYKYSKWNFSPKERMDSLRERSLNQYELLLPKPKQIQEKGIVKIDQHSTPVIITDKNPAADIRTGVSLLKKTLEDCGIKNEIPIYTAKEFEDKKSLFSLVFKVYTLSTEERNGKEEQGYSIHVSDNSSADIINIEGHDNLGSFYGLSTLIQLIDTVQKVLFTANIYDYPDFLGRSYLFTSWNDSLDFQNDYDNLLRMSLLRFNKAYIGYGQTKNRKDWYNPDSLYINSIQKIGEWFENHGGANLAIMVNPYYHFEYEMYVPDMSDSLKNIWQHDNEGMKMLKAVFDIGLRSGATTIMLMGDDFVPHEKDYRKLYSLWTDKDKKQHKTLAGAQAFMINELYLWLEQEYPQTRFEFCPPWYLNEFIDKSRGMAEAYFDELMPIIPEDIAIIWTGNTVRSLQIDEVDIYRFEQLSGRTPMLWDNTFYARGLEGIYGGYPSLYPEKSVLCNLFEPFDIDVPAGFHMMNDSRHMYINGSAGSEIYKIKYATLSDFLWNTDEYNPELSLWKVLLKWYGSNNALLLIDVNNSYYKLLRYILMTEIKNEDVNKYQRQIEKEIKVFDDLILNLKKDIRSEKLALEIDKMGDSLKARFKSLHKKESEDNKGERQI